MGYTSNVSNGSVLSKSVNNGDTLNIYNNGVGSYTSVSLGGSLNVYNNGIIRNTTIDKNGAVYVTSGGSAFDTNIKAGYLFISNGSNNYVENTTATYADISISEGLIVNTTLNEGGSLYISDKGVASNVAINNTKDLGVIVSNNGQIYGATINSGGSMDVTSTGYAQDTVLNFKGNLSVKGGVVSNTSTNNYSLLTITSNGSAYDNTFNGGTILISNGSNNYLENTIAKDATISITDGQMVGTTLNDYGTIFVAGNGVVSNTTINNIKDLGIGVSNNGKVYGTTINSGAVMDVSSAGYVYDTTISNGGTMNVSSSGYAYSTTISSGGTMNVSSAGYAQDTVLYAKGKLNVDGGVLSNTSTNTYSLLTITGNGSAYNNTVNGATILISNGSNNYLENTVAKDATISITDGLMISTTLNDYGTIFVAGNGVVSNTIINNSKDIGIGVSNYGKVYNTTINSAGLVEVSSAGNIYNTTVNTGGILNVSSSGYAYDTTISTGGVMNVSSFGYAQDTTVRAKASLNVEGGIVSNTTTLGYSLLTITSNGSAYNNTFNGGTILVSNGSNNYLENTTAAIATISVTDGKMVGTTLNDYATIFVTDNGVLSNTIINNASDLGIGVSNNGKVYGTTINSGAVMSVSTDGYAYDTTVNQGGNLFVFNAGAIASKTIIENNGVVQVYNSGQVFDTTINEGGLLSVYNAGITHDVTVNKGGSLIIDQGAFLDGTADIYNGGSAVIWGSAGGNVNLLGDNNTQLVLTGLNDGGNATIVINNFAGQEPGNSDSIILEGVNPSDVVSVAYEDSNGNASSNHVTLTLKNGSKITMNIMGAENAGYNLSSNNGQLVYEVCFLTGSMIRTINGEIEVENLRVGDQIITYDWKNNQEIIQNVKWVGYKNATVNPDKPDDMAGYPVRILRNAIAENVPYKDLLITPEHCLFFGNNFVPVRMLVNGINIFYDYSIQEYTYYHVETDTHSVIWADGMLTESYLDTGNRYTFKQHDNNIVLFPQRRTAKSWGEDGCAALVTDRNNVEPLFNQLLARAKELGLKEPSNSFVIDDNPNLCLQTDDGSIIYPHARNQDRFIFTLPSNTQTIHILSQSSRPCDAIGPFVDDRRELGVLIGDITLLSRNEIIKIDTHLSQNDLEGWHGIESHLYRWTNGHASLPLSNRKTKHLKNQSYDILIVHVVAGGPYLSLTKEIKKIA